MLELRKSLLMFFWKKCNEVNHHNISIDVVYNLVYFPALLNCQYGDFEHQLYWDVTDPIVVKVLLFQVCCTRYVLTSRDCKTHKSVFPVFNLIAQMPNMRNVPNFLKSIWKFKIGCIFFFQLREDSESVRW